MDQQDIISMLQKDEICESLDTIGRIHVLTKHYLLVAEELSEDGVAFLQPLKEHRDAYDHLMRIFAIPIRTWSDSFNCEAYIVDNVKKAVGHEYRAFFDAADWLTFICRKTIREALSLPSVRKEYSQNYDDFSSVQTFVNELPIVIAKFRETKDVSNKANMLTEVSSYTDTIEKLLGLCQRIKAIQGFV